MDDSFTIGKIAQLLDIPAATIRYWEEQGLFSVKKGHNRYRRYDLGDLIRIADVVSLRNLGIPIKQVTQFQACTLDQYQQSLLELEHKLNDKLAAYQRRLRLTLRQKQCAGEVLRLQTQEFQPEEVPFQAVAAFDYREQDKLLQYCGDPTVYVRYFDSRDLSTETRCIILPPDSGEGPLWTRPEGGTFLTFLIRELVHHDYRSDVEEKLAVVQRRYRTGKLLAQYLLTAMEGGELTDYLKAYVEVWPLDSPGMEDAL